MGLSILCTRIISTIELIAAAIERIAPVGLLLGGIQFLSLLEVSESLLVDRTDLAHSSLGHASGLAGGTVLSG